jgi:hypothetical protein
MVIVWQTALTVKIELGYNPQNGGVIMKRALPFLPLIVLIACSPDIADPQVQAAVINSLTATVWTPTPVTPTSTAEPHTGKIVDMLNGVIVGADPLGETILAKYSVVDAQVLLDAPTQRALILRVHVDCEWIYSDSCTPESTFVVLMYALSENEKVMKRIQDQIPSTVETLEVVAFDRMAQTGVIHISWGDVWDFAEGNINGNQLGSRMIRMAATP